MQQLPSHLPAAYWSANAAYNGQAAGAGWANGNIPPATQTSQFHFRGGRGGRRGRGGQQRQHHPYQQQQQRHEAHATSHGSGGRGGRGRGGGRGAEGQMNQVWYKASFMDDPWAILERRQPQPILLTHGIAPSRNSVQTDADMQYGNGGQVGAAADEDEATGSVAAAQSFVTQSSLAEPSLTVDDRPSLTLPPPRYS